ncbi:MAG: alpha/beta fold hydrolase [Pseudomonadales bacterium]|nr:alpha/beta fold hydrolase [Pseudomonadales bacterium]
MRISTQAGWLIWLALLAPIALATTQDRKTYELMVGPSTPQQGLIVFLPGSGCEPVASQVDTIFADAPGSWRVLTPEKRDTRSAPWSYLGCSRRFHRHTTYQNLIAADTDFARRALEHNDNVCARVLIGYSEGGTVAPFVAAAVPGFTRVIALSAGALRGEDELRMTLRRNLDAASAERTLARIRAFPNDIDQTVEGETFRYWNSMLDLEPMRAYQSIDIPVLMLHGDEDSVVPVEAAHFAAAQSRALGKHNMTVEVIHGADHSLGSGTADGRARLWRRIDHWLEGSPCRAIAE